MENIIINKYNSLNNEEKDILIGRPIVVGVLFFLLFLANIYPQMAIYIFYGLPIPGLLILLIYVYNERKGDGE